MQTVTMYTDGACSGNPGAGGWAAILKYGEAEKELCGGEKMTTNNRMELTAVIEGLSILKRSCEVKVFSDSRYIVDAIEKGWLASWQRKKWMRNKNEPVLNVDLWQRLLPLLELHNVTFIWVRGHNGNEMNERCDKLAVSQVNKTG